MYSVVEFVILITCNQESLWNWLLLWQPISPQAELRETETQAAVDEADIKHMELHTQRKLLEQVCLGEGGGGVV